MMRLSHRTQSTIAILALFLFVGLPIIWFGVTCIKFFLQPWRPGPWIPYDVALPDGGRLTYEWREMVARKIFFSPSDWYHQIRVVWTTPQGCRYSFCGSSVEFASSPDIEFRLRHDRQGAWLVSYPVEGTPEEPYVCCCLDFATGKFMRRSLGDTWGHAAFAGESLQEQRSHTLCEELPDWATVDGGEPLARWLYVYRWPYPSAPIMLHWSPRFPKTVLRKKKLDDETYALLVESPNSIYRSAEVRRLGWDSPIVIVAYSTAVKPKVRATFNFDRNEFTDESLTVWNFGKKPEDPITIVKPSDLAILMGRILAREHKANRN